MRFLPQPTWQSSNNSFSLTNNTQPSLHSSCPPCLAIFWTYPHNITTFPCIPEFYSSATVQVTKARRGWYEFFPFFMGLEPSVQSISILLTYHYFLVVSCSFSLLHFSLNFTFSIKGCKGSLFCPINFLPCAACNFLLHFQYIWVSFLPNDYFLGQLIPHFW